MTSTQAHRSDEGEPLCPECGYNLTGLEHDSTCPECGYKRETDEIIMWGTMLHGAMESLAAGCGAELVLTVVISFVMFLFLGYGWGFWQSLLVIFVLGGVPYIVVKGYQQWHRQSPSLDARDQLRVRSSGFATRSGFGSVQWVPWRRNWRVTLTERSEPILFIQRPLLRRIIWGQPLIFCPKVQPEEARSLADAIGRWIKRAEV